MLSGSCRPFSLPLSASCRYAVVTLSASLIGPKGTTLKHDAAKLRLLRESMGMTQEKLSILSSVSERTVQRAEAGGTMSLETLNDFAAALEIPISELVYDPDEKDREAVTGLRRVTVARTLLDDLARSGVAAFDCELDPTPSEMDTVLALVSLIEARLPSPWYFHDRPADLSLREKIEIASAVSNYLASLQEAGIGLYASASWILARYPRYDMDEGVCSTSLRQPYERVMTLQILLSRNTDSKIYRKPPTSWGLDEAPPPQPSFANDLDDDVPF